MLYFFEQKNKHVKRWQKLAVNHFATIYGVKNGLVILSQNLLGMWFVIHPVKGAVSYRFSQGLLTLMCSNWELKADINFFFFLLRRQTS